jgi:predicted secreted Zn-dependent protease
MSNHLNQSPPSRRSKRDSTADFLVSILLVTTILATAGFGTLPDNPITTAFQTVIGQYVPEVWLNPINDSLSQLSVSTIQPLPAVTPKPTFDLVDPLSTSVAIVIPKMATFIATGIPFISVRESDVPVAAGTPNFAPTPTLAFTRTATITATPSLTSTPSLTATTTATPTITRTPIVIDPETNCPVIAGATQVVCYDIEGSTESELSAMMDELSPVAPDKISTKWAVSWNWPGYGTNDCDLSSATVTLTELVSIMPRWDPPADASPQLVAKWNQYIQDGASRIQVYTDYVLANYLDVRTAIQNATCSTAETEAQKAVDALGASASQYANEAVGKPAFP